MPALAESHESSHPISGKVATDSHQSADDAEGDCEDDYPATVTTTGTIEVGGTATGEIEYAGDLDAFAVGLVAGRIYVIDLKGSSTNFGTLSDPYLRGIYDADSNRIANTTDDDGGDNGNSRVVFRPTESGAYYIVAGADSAGLGTYQLAVTEIQDDFAAFTETTGTVVVGGTAAGEIQHADDRDWFAVELEAGKSYQIEIGGVLTGGGTLPFGRLEGVYDSRGRLRANDPVLISTEFFGEDSQAFFTPDADGTYYVAANSGGSASTGTYTVRVAEIEDDFPQTVDTTGTVDVGGTATGEIQYETDRDWFAVELIEGETYKIELLGSSAEGGTLQDPYIRGIHNANGGLISDTTDYSSRPYSGSQVHFTPYADGTYYVAAGSYLTGIRDLDVGTYTLRVSIDDFRDDTDTTGVIEVGGSVTGEIETAGTTRRS